MLRSIASIALLMVLSAPAWSGPRVALVVEPDDEADAAATALGEALVESGHRLVDAATARQLRAAGAGALFDREPPVEVITGLDADLVLAVRVAVEVVEIELLGPAQSRAATLMVRAIQTDSARVVAEFTVRARRHGYTPRHAVDQALAKAARQAVERLERRLGADAPTTVELQITGLRDIADWAAVRRAIERVPGVQAIRPRHIDPRLTVAELDFVGAAERLAAALQAPGGPGLAVVQLSGRRLVARLDRARARPVRLLPTRFAGPLGAELSRALATALSGARGVELPRGVEPIRWPADRARWPDAAARVGGLDGPPLVLMRGRTRRARDQLMVQVELWQLDPPRMLLADQASCGDDLVGCARPVAERLARGVADRQLTATRAAVSARVSRFEDIFPRRAGAYAAGHTPGELSIHNAGASPVSIGRVCVRLGEHVPHCAEPSIPRVEAGGEARLPLSIALPEPWRANAQVRAVDVRVDMSVRRDGADGATLVAHRQVRLHRAGAMDWSQPDSAAAFVDPYTPALVARARQVVADDGLEAPWARAAVMFEVMRASGLRYVPDAVAVFGDRPVDDLSAPAETLRAGGGDCDDLAILFAALVGAVGVDAMLIVQPRHVLVAIDTGAPLGAATLVTLDDRLVVGHQGTAWLPIETTALDSTFVEAWRQGADRAADGARVVLRDAWQAWPPSASKGEAFPPLRAAPGAMEAARARVIADLEARLSRPDLEMATRLRMLIALDRLADAERWLDRLEATAETVNNQANLRLARGAIADAIASYRVALDRAPPMAEVRYNLALAAHLAGDGALFDTQIFALLDAGRRDLIDGLGRAARSTGGRRGDRRARSVTGLCGRLEATLEVRGQPSAPGCGSDRVANGASGPDVLTLVRWL